MTELNCQHCAFSNEEKGALFCRRYPPIAVLVPQVSRGPIIPNQSQQVNLAPAGIFPPVSPQAWCGEFIEANKILQNKSQ